MTGSDTAPRRGGTMRVVRSRGALSGFLLVLLGIWGALIPFVGPYFNYAYSPSSTWTWTAGRFWLEILPGAAAVVAGLLLMTTANRSVGVFAGWLASLAGGWFLVGPVLGRLWDGAEGAAGTPVGSTARQVWEQIGFFSGLGAVILFLGAVALGRFTVTSIRDLRAAERARGTEREPAPATTFRDNRVAEPTREVPVVREQPVVREEPVIVGSGKHTRTADADSTPTRPAEAMTRPVAEVTRPQGAAVTERTTSSEGSRGEGFMGRMRDRVRGDRTDGASTGSTRDDALDDRRS